MSSHARLAPSAAPCWMKCPGSVDLALLYTDREEETEYAGEGTFAHDVAALALRNRRAVRDYIGRVSPDGGQFKCDAEMARHLQTYVDAVWEVALLHEGTVAVEIKVSLAGRDDVWGTLDAVCYNDEVLHVYDLKYGAGVPVFPDSEQLKTYAVMFVDGLKRTGQIVPPRIVLHIVQPRRLINDQAHRVHELTRDELDEFRSELVTAAGEIDKGSQTYAAGKHCQFCPAKVGCSTLEASAISVTPSLPAVEGKTLQPVPAAKLTADQLGLALQNVEIIRTWLKAVEQEAQHRALKGSPIPGFKLVEQLGHRAWKSPKTAEKMLVKALGRGVYTPQELRSPAQIEKLGGRGIKSIVAGLTHRPTRGAALVSEKDRRPALDRTLAFTDLGEEPETKTKTKTKTKKKRVKR